MARRRYSSQQPANVTWMVAEEFKRRGWKQKHLEQRAKGDDEKLKIVQRLRCEKTMTLAWIAERLGMGIKTHLAHLL